VKNAIEQYIEMFTDEYSVDSLILRPSNVYGTNAHNIGMQGTIPTFCERIKNDEKITIYGDGEIIRDYLHVHDLVSFIILSLKKGLTGVYNVGSGTATSLNDLLSILFEVSSKEVTVEYIKIVDADKPHIMLK